MMLAQGTPSAQGLMDFVLIIGLLASIAGNIAMVVSARKTQKREVSFGFIPAAKDEFDKHVEDNRREHESLFSKIGGVERGHLARMDAVSREWRTLVDSKMTDLMKSNDEGRENLHRRINEVLAAVSELKGEVKVMNRR